MTLVYYYKIPINFDFEKYIIEDLINEERLIKAKNLPKLKRISSLLAEIIVKIEIAKILNIYPYKLSIVRTSKGKPYLKDFPHVHFNISHSKEAIVIAISDSEIGIDIEKISKYNPKVSERYFSESEKLYIENHSSPDLAFYEIWTAKEAYFKRSGNGLTADFFKTSVLDENIKKQIHSFKHNDFLISICTDNPNDFKFNELDSDYFENLKKSYLKCINCLKVALII